MKRFFLLSGLMALSLSFCVDASGQRFLNKIKTKAKEIKQTVEVVTGPVNSTSRTSSRTPEVSVDRKTENTDDYVPPKLHDDLPEGKIITDSIKYHVTEKTKRYTLKSNQYPYITDYHDGMAIVKSDGNIFFLDREGNKITPERDIILNVTDQRPGRIHQFDNGRIIVNIASGGYGIMDKNGKIIKVLPSTVNDAVGFCNGVGVLMSYNEKNRASGDSRRYKIQYIDVNGNNIWPALSIPTTATLAILRPLRCGLRAIQKYDPAEDVDKWGFVDDKGTVKIAPRYSEVRDFCNGIAAVREYQSNSLIQTGRWGYIDSLGNQVIDFVFSHEPGDFNAGKAIVKSKDHSLVVINEKGDVLCSVPAGWHITDFSPEGYAIYLGSVSRKVGSARRAAYCIKDAPENKIAYAEFDGSYKYSPESNMFYVEGGYPSLYIPIDVLSMTSLPTKAQRPFCEGLGIVENGVIDLDGNYVVIFEPNKF